MPEFFQAITVADIATLKAIASPKNGQIRKVANVGSSYGTKEFRFEAGATYTEQSPGILADNTATGFWVMNPEVLVLATADPSTGGQLPNTRWINITNGNTFISNPDLSFVQISGGSSGGSGGSGLAPIEITDADSPYTASSGELIIADTTNGAIAINLPASGADGLIQITDKEGTFGTNNLTITPDGADTIEGSVSLTMDQNNDWMILAIDAASTNWERTAYKGKELDIFSKPTATPVSGDFVLGSDTSSGNSLVKFDVNNFLGGGNGGGSGGSSVEAYYPTEIALVELQSATAQVDFAQDFTQYDRLELHITAASSFSGGEYVEIFYNDDFVTTNYDRRMLEGASNFSNTSFNAIGAIPGQNTPDRLGLLEFALSVPNNATAHKSALFKSAGTSLAYRGGIVWQNNAAITKLSLVTANNANFVAGSRFRLFGWKKGTIGGNGGEDGSVNAIAETSGAIAVDWSNRRNTVTIDGAATLSHTGIATAFKETSLLLTWTSGAITWGVDVWIGGVAPTQTGKVYEIELFTYDSGTTIYGSFSQLGA